MLICTLSGCNSKTDESTDTKKSSSVSESSKSEKSSDKMIDFSKLDWKVEEEIIDGKRLPIFSYTNNTDVTICDFVLVFKQKETTTRQDLSVFKEATDALEISGDALDKLDFTASCKLFTKPGETNGNDTIAIDNRIGYRVTDMKQYALMEPDYATIAFLDGGYIYGMNYDFKNEKSTPVKKAVEAYNWTDSELGKAIPKLECEVTKIGMDDEETFSVTGYDFSEEMREAYINACIDMGYKTDDKLTDTYVDFYKGNYEVDVDYYEKNKELQIRVEKLTESELKEAESSRQESSKLS
jgi:hypothetical protein